MDNIFVQCGRHVFQQMAGIPMETTCAPLLTDLFIGSYEADFIADLIQRKEHHLARSFDLSFHYIDNVLSFNNPSLRDLMHYIYTIELEIKDITDTVKSASYLDLYLEIN